MDHPLFEPKSGDKVFDNFCRSIYEQSVFITLSRIGIEKITIEDELIELIEGQSIEKLNAIKKRMTTSDFIRFHAKQEVNNGYPHLYANFSIRLWSYLDDVIVYLFAKTLFGPRKGLKLKNPIRKIKIRFGDYEELSLIEKHRHLIELLISEISMNDFRIDCFEKVSDFLELKSASVASKNDLKNLRELQNVRNCLVHNSGIVDRTFVNRCGWMTYKKGDAIKISSDEYEKYQNSVLNYYQEVLERTAILGT